MKPTCKTESNLFYRYLYFVFAPKLVSEYKNFDSDPMTGVISLEFKGFHLGKPFDVVYCSPMWEENTENIEFEFHSSEDGFQNRNIVSFPLDSWTMDVNQDVERFVDTVTEFMCRNTYTVE